MKKKIVVSGVGCCLVDLLYNDIDFRSDAIRPYLSIERGDGGLTPGQLVFKEEFEKMSGSSFEAVLESLTGGRTHDKINIGGPSVVSLIHAAQMTNREQCEIRFYGRGGNDDNGRFLLSSLKMTPVVIRDFKLIDNQTPSTVVLSDPTFDNGHGERIFINSIAAAWDYRPEELSDDFFKTDITVFGGTALVPHIHDNMTSLLQKAKSNGCITIVNTVFDFRNEKLNPNKRWPLGESDLSYRYIDLLIADREEALRLSGETDLNSAIKFFQNKELSALIITNGSKNIFTYSDGRFLSRSQLNEMPVSQRIISEKNDLSVGDTTGCGDNFVGGVISSIVNQIVSGIAHPDLKETCSRGIVSGGFACFYLGGTYLEDNPGEKRSKIEPYYDAYRKQIEG
jgi:sugar/nucleoside kinase (ribokinase family)